MYHESGFFSSHGAHPIQGGEEAFGGPLHHPSINYSDLSLMGHEIPPSSSSLGVVDLDLELHRQFGFDMKQELNFNHCFDPSIAMNRMMDPLLYDARVQLGLPADDHDEQQYSLVFHSRMPNDECGGFVCGSRGSTSGGGGLEEGYRIERAEMMNNNNNGGVIRKKIKGGTRVVEKHEKQRRERLSKKYDVLKSLIPNPTKPDRATIVADTISYINELLRTIDELKILVEKKHHRMERSKRLATGDEVIGDMDSYTPFPLIDGNDNAFKRTLRSSWLQRKSKETTVDVRIIEDEAIIKLTQRRRINVLLVVSKVLDELQLELLHLSGGNIGDYHIFLFNTKIHEGSSVYASAIAKKIIEVVDLQSSPPYAC